MPPDFNTDKLWGKLVLLDRRTTPPTMSYWDEPTQTFINIGSAIAPAMALLYDRIAPAGGVTDFTYDPIDTNYAHLIIMASIRLTASATDHAVFVQFNGDDGANYKSQNMYAYSGGVGADAELTERTAAVLGGAADASVPAGNFGHTRASILNYQSSDMCKALTSESTFPYNSGADLLVFDVANQWQSTAPITSLKIFPTTGSFAEHSRISIFGLVHGG